MRSNGTLCLQFAGWFADLPIYLQEKDLEFVCLFPSKLALPDVKGSPAQFD